MRKSPSRLIDERIEALDDWRGAMLSQLRTLIKHADPEVVEEWKWRGVAGVVSRRIRAAVALNAFRARR